MKLHGRVSLSLLFAAFLFGAPAFPAQAPFYQGKNIAFLINFAAGGPTDIEGRIVAGHLAKHIPGNPTIIVQNMAGAGGVTGINCLGEAAKKDGLTVKEAVLAMRQAFAELSKDEDFIAEAKKAMRFQPRFDVGEDGEKLRDRVLKAPAEIVDFVHKFIAEARK